MVTGEQSIQRDDLTEAEKNLISLIALEDSSKDVSFTSSAFTLKEGRHIQKGDRKKILIHEDLAKKNNLKLGDKISLNPAQVEGNSGQRLDYEIVGIFSGKKQEKFTGRVQILVKIRSIQTTKVAKLFLEIRKLKLAPLVSI